MFATYRQSQQFWKWTVVDEVHLEKIFLFRINVFIIKNKQKRQNKHLKIG